MKKRYIVEQGSRLHKELERIEKDMDAWLEQNPMICFGKDRRSFICARNIESELFLRDFRLGKYTPFAVQKEGVDRLYFFDQTTLNGSEIHGISSDDMVNRPGHDLLDLRIEDNANLPSEFKRGQMVTLTVESCTYVPMCQQRSKGFIAAASIDKRALEDMDDCSLLERMYEVRNAYETLLQVLNTLNGKGPWWEEGAIRPEEHFGLTLDLNAKEASEITFLFKFMEDLPTLDFTTLTEGMDANVFKEKAEVFKFKP